MSSIKKLKKQIYEFQNMGLDTSIEKYKYLLNQIINGYRCITRTIDSEYCFRARINTGNTPFIKTNELHYPPSEFVSSMGRMNRAKASIFYIAASHETATLEIRPSVGDVITVMRYKLKNLLHKPHVMELGVAETNSEHNLGGDVHIIENTNAKRLFKNRDEIDRNILIRNLLSQELMKIITKENQHLYKRTIAIYELLSSADRIDGLEYPSIAGDGSRKYGGTNLALKPKSADLLFEPEYAWMSKVINTHDTFGYEMQCINNSESIIDGTITWKNNGC